MTPPMHADIAAIARDEKLFDNVAFARRVRVAMAEDNLSLRKLQAVTGVDQASIHRAAVRELPPSIETYLRLIRWLDARDHLLSEDNGNG